MKWVWIRPLVLQPQTKKVANSTQKIGTRAASLSVFKRRHQQRQQAGAGGRRRRYIGFAVERQVEIGGPVAHEDQSDHARSTPSTQQTNTSAMRQP